MDSLKRTSIGAPDRGAMLYGLDDQPPTAKALVAAGAHLLAIVASIATAPLLIALALGLTPAATAYVVSSALIISGFATFLQVFRLGPFGSGLLSIQGTSFAFIGVFAYAGQMLTERGLAVDAAVGTLVGSAGVGALLTIGVGAVAHKLARVITPRVTGVVIFLLGVSLVLTAWKNFSFTLAGTTGSTIPVWLQALGVIGAIAFLATRGSPLLRLFSIPGGLTLGLIIAWISGSMTFPETMPGGIAMLEFQRFPLGFDPVVCLLLLPIYLVTVAESVGDLTATSLLSDQPLEGPAYWRRIRGGVMGDGLNSVIASVFGTFPNTTFSQNNGVIQVTGVASRAVGYLVAGGLVVLGLLPAFSHVFTLIPGGVLHATTGLLFAMIALAGLRILNVQADRRRAYVMLVSCSVLAALLTQAPAAAASLGAALPEYLSILLGFPVATGAIIAIIWEAFDVAA